MRVKLLIEHYLVFLSLIGDCTGSSGSALVKKLQCWKSHVSAHFIFRAKQKSGRLRDNNICNRHLWKAYSLPARGHFSSAGNHYKQVGLRSGPTECRSRSGSKPFDADSVPERIF